jgi:D-alanyl-D-alanine carboxypeptidase
MRPALLALCLFLTACAAIAAPPQSTSPAVQFAVAEAEARGLSGTILIRRDGEAGWLSSHGLADRAFAVPMRTDTRLRIASITKLFTSAIIMQMADEGRLDVGKPVATYLPGLAGEARTVSLHQLLNHSSGIAQYDKVASLEQALVEGVPNYQKPMTPAQMLAACCTGKLAAKPGSKFDYNNADYLLLGRIIERIDGRPFEQSLQARILAPLGLKDSGIAHHAAIIPRLAPAYFLRPDTKTWMNDLPMYYENSDAAGAMYSTAPDIARFAEALFGGKLVSAASLQRMLTPSLDDYGYGLWSYDFKRGGKTYRVAKRPGSIMGANAVLYRLLDQRVTIVILANSNAADLDELAQRIAERLVDQVPSSSS